MPESVVADARSAFAIVDGLPLWTLSGESLAPRETMLVGERLSLLGQSTKCTVGGKERDYAQVKRESGSTGRVRADFVVSKAILAVVTSDNAVIYSVAHNT